MSAIRVSLRSRVALAAVLATVIAVLLAGVAILTLARRDQQNDLDRELQAQVEQVRRQGLAALFSNRQVPRPPNRGDLNLGVRVLDGTEELFGSGFPTLEGVIPDGFSDHDQAGEGWRVLSVEVSRPGPRGGELTLQVSGSTAGIEAALRALRRILLFVGLLAVTGAALGGWLLGTVVARPVAGLRREAERVSETVDLSVRVPEHQGPPEVDDLAHSLNAMLARIEEGAAQTQAALDASRGFAGNVAHELRTPLTSMQTNLEVLAANPDLPRDELAAIVADVVAQQRRLLEALEALRLLARGDLAAADLFELTDLAELVDAAVAQAQARFPEATITLAVPADPPPARVWPEGVRVLLDNLIRNAVTHGAPPAGGSPSAEVGSPGDEDGVPAEVTVSLSDDGRDWTLAVEDHGPGIPPAERAQVLERFARGSGARAMGSGLGLALVAQQAELHGGAVTIEDAPTGGARIAVRAPLRPPSRSE